MAMLWAQKIMYAETKEEAIALYKRVPRLLKDKVEQILIESGCEDLIKESEEQEGGALWIFGPTSVKATSFPLTFILKSPLYYRVVVIRAPLQGLCYTVRDAVDWCIPPTTRWFQRGSNHSPLQFC